VAEERTVVRANRSSSARASASSALRAATCR
jgi:hypothetical protein